MSPPAQPREAAQYNESAASPAPGGTSYPWRGLLLCLAVPCCTLAFSFWWTSFAEVKMAVLAASLVILSLFTVLERSLPRGGGYAFLPLWLFLAYANLAARIRPAYSLALTAEETLRILLVLLVPLLCYGLLASPLWQTRLKQSIIATGAIAAVLGILQYLRLAPFLFPVFDHYDQPVYSVFGNQDLFGGYLAIALSLSLLGWLKSAGGRIGYGFVSLLLALGLALSASRSAWLAAAVGLCIATASAGWPWRRALPGAAALGILAVALMIAVPAQTVDRVTETFASGDLGGRLRLWFWEGTWEMFQSSPLFGKGLGNYAFYSPRYLGAALLGPGGDSHAYNELHTENAHCDPLELLAETGIVGGLFLLWMLVRLIRCRGEEWAPLAALLTFSLFNGTFQSAPHALAGVLLGGMLLARRFPPSVPRGRVAATASAGACVLTACLFLLSVFLPSYYLRAAEDLHVTEQDPVAAYERVLAFPWPQPLAHEELAMALLEQGEPAAAEAHLNRAMLDMDTGRLYALLGQAAEAQGALKEARDWYLLCLLRWPWHEESWNRFEELSSPQAYARVRERFGPWAPSPTGAQEE